jgi:hypothetical protein
MDRTMRLFNIKNIISTLQNMFTNTSKLDQATIHRQDQNDQLDRISKKAHAHLEEKKRQGLPADGPAHFQAGAIISEKFWGVDAKEHKNQFKNASSRTDPAVNDETIDFDNTNIVSLKDAALALRRKQEELARHRTSFAGIPMYRIDDAFEKIAKNTEVGDMAYQVAELNFDTKTAEIHGSDGQPQSIAQGYKALKIAI